MKKSMKIFTILTFILIISNFALTSATPTPYNNSDTYEPDCTSLLCYVNHFKNTIFSSHHASKRIASYICDKCYGSATASCNGELIVGPTYFHGNCPFISYTSKVRVDCNYCSNDYILHDNPHPCLESHTGCGLGRQSVCPFR